MSTYDCNFMETSETPHLKRQADETEIYNLKQQVKQFQALLASAQDTIVSLKAKSAETDKKFEDFKAEMEDRIIHVKSDVEDRTSTESKATKTLCSSLKAQLERSNKQNHNEISILRSQLDAERNRTNTMISNLKTELGFELQSTRDDITSKISDLTDDLAQEKSEALSRNQQSVIAITRRLDDCDKNIFDVRDLLMQQIGKDIGIVEHRIESHEKDVDESIKKYVCVLNEKIEEESRARLLGMEEMKTEYEMERERIIEKHSEQENAILETKHSIEQAKDIAKGHKENLLLEIDGVRKEMALFQSSVPQHYTPLSSIESLSRSVQKDITELRQVVDEYREDILDQRKEIQSDVALTCGGFSQNLTVVKDNVSRITSDIAKITDIIESNRHDQEHSVGAVKNDLEILSGSIPSLCLTHTRSFIESSIEHSMLAVESKMEEAMPKFMRESVEKHPTVMDLCTKIAELSESLSQETHSRENGDYQHELTMKEDRTALERDISAQRETLQASIESLSEALSSLSTQCVHDGAKVDKRLSSLSSTLESFNNSHTKALATSESSVRTHIKDLMEQHTQSRQMALLEHKSMLIAEQNEKMEAISDALINQCSILDSKICSVGAEKTAEIDGLRRTVSALNGKTDALQARVNVLGEEVERKREEQLLEYRSSQANYERRITEEFARVVDNVQQETLGNIKKLEHKLALVEGGHAEKNVVLTRKIDQLCVRFDTFDKACEQREERKLSMALYKVNRDISIINKTHLDWDKRVSDVLRRSGQLNAKTERLLSVSATGLEQKVRDVEGRVSILFDKLVRKNEEVKIQVDSFEDRYTQLRTEIDESLTLFLDRIGEKIANNRLTLLDRVDQIEQQDKVRDKEHDEEKKDMEDDIRRYKEAMDKRYDDLREGIDKCWSGLRSCEGRVKDNKALYDIAKTENSRNFQSAIGTIEQLRTRVDRIAIDQIEQQDKVRDKEHDEEKKDMEDDIRRYKEAMDKRYDDLREGIDKCWSGLRSCEGRVKDNKALYDIAKTENSRNFQSAIGTIEQLRTRVDRIASSFGSPQRSHLMSHSSSYRQTPQASTLATPKFE
ncbi:hypothetical protein ADUPG1_010492 [Aduncisulcus paluster]|uniref:Uncharacterized protein n=1 Tax=Aduncisulcus paluster TaxID=2918883 RepID=A0ABQ5JRL8_9EUKA|nr:hypothetical protein ADUPG1_010492 [Aduncisulcus paluster]